MNSTRLWNSHQIKGTSSWEPRHLGTFWKLESRNGLSRGFHEAFSTTDAMLFSQNTWKTGNKAFEMSQAFQDQGCQPPTSLNIKNWWGRDDKWHHNAHSTWRYLWKKKRKKDVVEIVTFDQIGLLPTNHIIAYITMAYRSLWGNVRC